MNENELIVITETGMICEREVTTAMLSMTLFETQILQGYIIALRIREKEILGAFSCENLISWHEKRIQMLWKI